MLLYNKGARHKACLFVTSMQMKVHDMSKRKNDKCFAVCVVILC